MREDMDRVLITRPRFGRSQRKMNRMRANKMAETAPRKQGLKRQRAENGTRTKHFNDHIAPLERFLAKQVGRPWDKVYGELRERIKPGHLLQEHLMEHVWAMVQRPTIGRDGDWVWNGAWWVHRFGPRDGQLYIHPKDGLLKRWKEKTKPARR